jgi:hypothetical protein
VLQRGNDTALALSQWAIDPDAAADHHEVVAHGATVATRGDPVVAVAYVALVVAVAAVVMLAGHGGKLRRKVRRLRATNEALRLELATARAEQAELDRRARQIRDAVYAAPTPADRLMISDRWLAWNDPQHPSRRGAPWPPGGARQVGSMAMVSTWPRQPAIEPDRRNA